MARPRGWTQAGASAGGGFVAGMVGGAIGGKKQQKQVEAAEREGRGAFLVAVRSRRP
jgi:hypothetical protein